MKDNYLFAAIFTKENNGYSVEVPNLEGCFSEGNTLEEAYDNIHDAIGLNVEYLLENNEKIPATTDFTKIKTNDDQFMSLVEFSLKHYKDKEKSVKKTLTIPYWLNEKAVEQNLNFSQVLKDAIIQRIDN